MVTARRSEEIDELIEQIFEDNCHDELKADEEVLLVGIAMGLALARK
jgi:hypothetical protein